MLTYQAVIESISSCPTAYHVVDRIKQKTHALPFNENMVTPPNVAWIAERAGSSAILFSVPENFDPSSRPSFDIVAAHTDSPAFKVKTNPISFDNGYIRLNVEKYGGMLVRTWLDRPVSIAGRVFVRTKKGDVVTRLVDLKEECRGVIPSLAPHMDRDIESKELSIQNHMRPILGLVSDTTCSEERYFTALLCRSLNKQQYVPAVTPDNIVSFDLFVYDIERPSFLVNEMSWNNGSNFAAGMVMSPRLDNQVSVWCAMAGFIDVALHSGSSRKENIVSVLALFDAEEVGSACASGADSDFLSSTLHDIADILGFGSPHAYNDAIARSFLVSADGGHALHPGYPHLADPTNKCVLGDGILLKHAAHHAYMTDGLGKAVFGDLCEKAHISYQDYQNNSDVKGGATLGALLSTHVGIAGVDVGIPQLAMHSACECASTRDIQDFAQFFTSFYKNERISIR